MSTHTLTAAEEISNRVGIMNHGRLIFDGTIEELRGRFSGEDQSLESMYLAMTEQRPFADPQATNGAMLPSEREGISR
jgi:ABC-2 type transport system ATP-binding protein